MAEFHAGSMKFGFSVRAFMAFIFSITACVLAIKKIMPIDVFVVILNSTILFYFQPSSNPHELKKTKGNGDNHATLG